MAVPSTFADLNTTPASNSGLISDSSAVNVIDDHARTIYALIASIYANSGNGWASPYLPAANPVYTGTLTGGTGIVNLGSGQLYKDGSGNVGLGTPSPASRLHTYSASGASRLTVQSNSNGAEATIKFQGNSTAGNNRTTRTGINILSDDCLETYDDTNSQLVDRYLLNGYRALYTAGLERLRIDGSGNVGIGGVPRTGNKLDVFGDACASNYEIGDSAAAEAGTYGFLNSNGPAVEVWGSSSANAGALLVKTGGTERMRVASTGDILFGKSAADTSNPGCFFEPASTINYGRLNFVKGSASGAGATSAAAFYYNATQVGTIACTSTATAYNTSSDARLKASIAPAADAGALLDAVQVRQFDWLSDGSHQRFGFIAQELIKVVPEAVHAPADPDDMLAVDYSKLVPLLVREIQALRARVAALEA